ncbi:hypothetical protein [Stenoxybacter acetivorans]|uniref:hypothetical protein n=1 Tax=Stenoxybacter acetivorans TaxID=422441 RepID=UPI0012EC2763|nr:hypothetical protein [Stenoxybacter acetivorans]
MDNQLQKLETSLQRVLAQCKLLAEDKRRLTTEVGRLREQNQQQQQAFQAERTSVTQENGLKIKRLEAGFQKTINDLKTENQDYQMQLQQIAKDIDALAKRVPVRQNAVMQKETQSAAVQKEGA